MSNLIIAPVPLVEILKVITQGFLSTNFRNKIQCFAKIDYNVLEHEDHCLIQITKCGLGCPELTLKLLLDNALTNHVNDKLLRETVVAVVEKKSGNKTITKKAIYTSRSSLTFRTVKIVAIQKDFCAFKYYTSIKFLFCLAKNDLQEFSILLEAHLKHTQDAYPKVKFVYRNGIQYFYRNLVPMDDILLSCNLVTSSLSNMLRNCRKTNRAHYDNLKKLLGIRKSGNFVKKVTCALVSKADLIFMNEENA